MNETQTITCINCPVGCRMTVSLENGAVTGVEGNTCKRGETYARQETTNPTRMLTAVVPVQNASTPLSVKTREPIPKRDIQACMEALSAISLRAPIQMGQVVLENIAATGVDVIATKSIDPEA